MTNLPTELYESIFKMLSSIELLNMLKVNKHFRQEVSKEIGDRFRNSIKGFFGDVKGFHNLLGDECLISGALLLNFIQGKQITNKIELYITEKTLSVIIEFLKKEKCLPLKSTDKMFGYQDHFNELDIKCYFKKIDNSFLKIFLIISSNPEKIIAKNKFDLAKSYYNGTHWYITKALITNTATRN